MSALTITLDNFEEEVMNSDKPVLLDFWAGWCGPCRMLGPVISELAEELDGKVKVGKINVDEQPELASEFGVSGIPMVLVMKDGKIVNKSVGYRPKADLLALL
ncbi:MAG: thioredoxin [Clostridiales bacterium]|nr:thioredoxin [Clostridiales bacterium]